MLQNDIDNLNRATDDFFLEVKKQLFNYKKRSEKFVRKFWDFKFRIYLKVKPICGIKIGQKPPTWFFLTIRAMFFPKYTLRHIAHNMK